MRTERQLWLIFKGICCLWFLGSTAVAAEFSQEVDPQACLDREKRIVEGFSFPSDESSQMAALAALEEREKKILSQAMEPIQPPKNLVEKSRGFAKNILEGSEKDLAEWEPIQPIGPAPLAFHYRNERPFQINPFTKTGEVTLPQVPEELKPFGPLSGKPGMGRVAPKGLASEPVAEVPKPEDVEIDKPESTKITVSAVPEEAQEDPSIFSFLTWIKKSQQENADELARKKAREFKYDPPKDEKRELEDDLFLNIRFPYKANDSAGGGSEAIYSEPDK